MPLEVDTLSRLPGSSGCALICANCQNNMEETANSNRKLRLYHFIFFHFIAFPSVQALFWQAKAFWQIGWKVNLKQMNMIIGSQPTRITLLNNLFRQSLFSYSCNWQNWRKITHVWKQSIVKCYSVPLVCQRKDKQTTGNNVSLKILGQMFI